MTIYKALDCGVEIVEYEERFAAGLAEMWNRSRESWGGGDGLDTEQSQLDTYRNGAYYNVYLALFGEEVVGLCSLARYYKDSDALYIHVLNVRPDFMSKKIGKALVLLSVERTIELGFPRLEIHTWAGNTKAVPVYKKCGYMWEDNSETTHLSNYIPTIISQELLRPFFDNADWYMNSTRKVEIKPDGIVSDGFEFFTYTWADKDGKNLAVTVEKFGRRICRVETDDYIVELTAENHALAYGFDYRAEVKTVNKSGKPLDVEARGKTDGAISIKPNEKSLDSSDHGEEGVYFAANTQKTFSVGKPESKQDPYRKHPCVLAEVTVNGMKLEMGVGIEVKPPLLASFDANRGVAFIGQRFRACITLESALMTRASIKLSLPENDYVRFDTSVFDIEIDALGKVCIETEAEVLKIGAVCIEATCDITLPDGQEKSFAVPFDIINQGLTERFTYMAENHYGIVNGPLHLITQKDSNTTIIKNILVNNLDPDEIPQFPVSKLGKPYDDEFNLAVPFEVKAFESEADIVMELSYRSEVQQGIAMTMIYTLNASGVITRKHRIRNSGDSAAKLYLSETVFSGIGHSAAYRYDGRFTLSRDAGDSGVGYADAALFEENWVFENNANYSTGVCWVPEIKPSFRYSDGIVLEHELHIEVGGVAETPPVTLCIGTFRDYSTFRDYAMQTYDRAIGYAEDLLEITVNDGNPFVYGDEYAINMRNNRSKTYHGSVEITSESGRHFAPQTVTFPENEKTAAFNVKLDAGQGTGDVGGVGVFRVRTDFPAYLSEKTRAVFYPSGQVECTEMDGAFLVSNGCLTFEADPKHYAGLFSMTDTDGVEWLMSKYPLLEPYDWWNPYIGGIHNWHEKMNAPNTLKESMKAGFVELKDNYGNLWQGIKTWVDVSENKEYRGLSYESFYLTLPGVPILGSFSRYSNNTGGFLNIRFSEDAYHQFGETDKRVAEVLHKSSIQKFVLGSSGFDTYKAEFVALAAEQGQKLHWLPNLGDRHSWASIGNGNRYFACYRNFNFSMKNSETLSTRPMFYVLSEKSLTRNDLIALETICF